MKELSSILYYKFIFKKEYEIRPVAKKMHISPDSLYRYCRGEVNMTIDKLKSLIDITGDEDLKDYLAKELGIRDKNNNINIKDAETSLFISIADLIREINVAIEDGVIDDKEFRILNDKINKNIQDLENLKSKIALYTNE